MDLIKHGMRWTDTHVYFFTENSPFSNFYHKPFYYDGFAIMNSETGFMLEKAKTFDRTAISSILSAKSPGAVKKAGRAIKNYNDEVWSGIRYEKMVKVLTEKFKDKELQSILLETGDRTLVEGSPYDGIWGVKVSWMSQAILEEANWQGENLLGKALMEVRDNIKRKPNG